MSSGSLQEVARGMTREEGVESFVTSGQGHGKRGMQCGSRQCVRSQYVPMQHLLSLLWMLWVGYLVGQSSSLLESITTL